ncbi:MAG: hypothetical protein ACPLKQ_08540 [Candidatus Bathyarchaeales archaeon]
MLVQLIQFILYAVLVRGNGSRFEWILRNLAFGVVLFLVELLVLAVVLYIAGRVVVGKKRALFSDAFIIALLGTILSSVFMVFIPYSFLALLLSIFTWLLLIKRLYETGWLGAVAVGILAIIVFVAVLVLIALLFGIFYLVFEWLFTIGL